MDDFEQQLGKTRERWLAQREAWGLTIDRWEAPPDQPPHAWLNLAYWLPGPTHKTKHRISIVRNTLDEAIFQAEARETELCAVQGRKRP